MVDPIDGKTYLKAAKLSTHITLMVGVSRL